MVVVCAEELQSKLASYCNWASLPRDLLASIQTSVASSSSAAATDDDALLAGFLQHLANLVPFEWSVMQQSLFDAAASSSSSRRNIHAMMHAPAVGTQEGILCFGGVQLGVLQEVRIENEVSWIKNTEPAGLAPDYSRVYQVGTWLGCSCLFNTLCLCSRRWRAPILPFFDLILSQLACTLPNPNFKGYKQTCPA